MKVELEFTMANARELNWLLKRRYGHRLGFKGLLQKAISEIVSDEAGKVLTGVEQELKGGEKE